MVNSRRTNNDDVVSGESDNRHINDETSMVTEGNVARAKQIRHQRGHLSSLVGFASVSIWVRVLGSVYRSNITIPFPFSHVP